MKFQIRSIYFMMKRNSKIILQYLKCMPSVTFQKVSTKDCIQLRVEKTDIRTEDPLGESSKKNKNTNKKKKRTRSRRMKKRKRKRKKEKKKKRKNIKRGRLMEEKGELEKEDNDYEEREDSGISRQ